MKIIRVFPRRTSMTPKDELVRINEPPGLFDEADEIHISVAFTWDRERAERLEKMWRHVAPTFIDGPAYGSVKMDFIPGKYLRDGMTITSRGCLNRCWFCDVWKRQPAAIELPIQDGYNILDDNLLECGEKHIKQVFTMLKRQKNKPIFSGGLEAARMKQWIANELINMKARFYFAYDTPNDLEPLCETMKLFPKKNNHNWWCYCLIGHKDDTFEKAEKRLKQILSIGLLPYAMLYRDEEGGYDKTWRRFQREWVRPHIVCGKK